MATFKILNEVKRSEITSENFNREQDWDLCLHEGIYKYDNQTSEYGFRFIYRRPGGNIQAARGGARIPSLEVADQLIAEARRRGWGNADYD